MDLLRAARVLSGQGETVTIKKLEQFEVNDVMEILEDLRKYANSEYQEAECSDNEREMRIHLEYENRIWGIMKSLDGGK